MKKFDLTHTISPEIPHWDDESCFSIDIKVDYDDCTAPNLFRVQKMEMKAGVGTHIDAPAHCFPDGKTIEGLELENLITDCVVIHIYNATETTVITPDYIENFEKENG